MHYGIHYRWNIYDYCEVPPYIHPLNGMKRIEIEFRTYNAFWLTRYVFHLLLIPTHWLLLTWMSLRSCKKGRKNFFSSRNEKWKNIHHELLLFVATHTNTFIIFSWYKGHEMRIQISMPIYNSIVWLIHSLGLNKFLSPISTRGGGFIMKYWKFSL